MATYQDSQDMYIDPNSPEGIAAAKRRAEFAQYHASQNYGDQFAPNAHAQPAGWTEAMASHLAGGPGGDFGGSTGAPISIGPGPAPGSAPGTPQSAYQGGGGLPSYDPYANFDPQNDPFAAFRVAGLNPSAASVQASQITPESIAAMQNPYTKQVTDRTLSDLERQRQMAQMTTDDQMRAAKAFGGDRHGVANSLTNEAFARTGANTLANLNLQGFNTAAGLAGTNAGLAQQAGLSNASNYLTGRAQDIGQNQGFMHGGLTQRGQDIGYNLGKMGQELNAYNVAGNLASQSGYQDWLSLNQASNAVGGGQNTTGTTTTPGADPYNTLISGLITGWGLTRP